MRGGPAYSMPPLRFSETGRETMGTTLERVAQDIRERAEQVRRELAERERAYRVETQQLRDELARLDAALRAMGGDTDTLEPERAVLKSPRAPRGQNRAKILAVVSERSGVSAAEVARTTGIASATVHSTLAKLTSGGELVKEQLPSGVVGYRVPDEVAEDEART
jgi:DNA-binding transcriptional ArsR family regulator